MLFYLVVGVVNKSATNLNIFNYSTCYVATVVAGNETADGNEVWKCGSILLYAAACCSCRVALSATRGFTVSSCCSAFPITNLIGHLKLAKQKLHPSKFSSLRCSAPANGLFARWTCIINADECHMLWDPKHLSWLHIRLYGSHPFTNTIQHLTLWRHFCACLCIACLRDKYGEI